ncbi:response regulator [Paenibacillus sp. GCM10023250]|uniref:response regulator n=1 Tax=Paenibacillus sp. GCM10023250 TaxID=3252648 RepID=UPI00360BED6E
MLALLLVDDHKLLVDSMAETLPWPEIGIGAVYRAYSGTEALQVLERADVHILVTDIRMPGITGLELIEQARTMNPLLHCVLLTGYAQFEYAKRAIELQATDYLIKPVKDNKLLETIGQIVNRMKEKSAEETIARQALRRNLPLLRSELLLELLTGDVLSRRALAEKLDMYELPFDAGDRCRLLMLDPDPAFERYSAPDRALMDYSILNIAEETLNADCVVWPAKSKRSLLVMLVKPREGSDETVHSGRLFRQLRKNVSDYLKCGLDVYASEELDFPGELIQAYRGGIAWLQMRTGNSPGASYSGGTGPGAERRAGALRVLLIQPTLMQLAKENDWRGLRVKVKTLLAEADKEEPYNRLFLNEAHIHLLSCFVTLAHDNGRVLEELAGPQAADPSRPMRSVDRLREWAEALLNLLEQELGSRSERNDTHPAVVRQVESYVRKHLDKDIALNALAEMVYLHPAYLSKIYKEKTGINLSDFILRTRMELALSLLSNPSNRIYEIAESVGYHSTQHFIQAFKKYYGATPKKYRLQLK